MSIQEHFASFITFMQGFFAFVVDRREQIITLLIDHIQLTVVAVLISIFIGVPVGILISRYAKLHKPVMGAVNIMQAIPSMAVLGFLIPFLGIGQVPAIFMVVLYSLMPIIKNTATGLLNINKETLGAAKAIGMTEFQILAKVQFPIALPVIMAGVRISAVTAVGLMTLASFIGASGLGYLIYSGVQMVNSYMILGGAIPACILALFMDFFFSKVEKAVTPISLRVGAPLPSSREKLLALRKKRKHFLSIVAGILAVLVFFVTFGGFFFEKEEKIVSVTSKYYPEQLLMGNMVSDLIEDKTDITVIRNLNMGGTQIAFEALNTGEVDIQVEYTGSMFASVLAQGASTDTQYVTDTVTTMYKDNYDLVVLEDWGFNNVYALAVREDTAEEFNLETITDLTKFSNNMIFTPTIEFSNLEDCLLGLDKMYSLNFKEVIPVDGGLRYIAIDNNECDVVVAYTTDPQVHGFNLKTLVDDKKFFMDYLAVPVIRADTLEKYPELEDAVNTLAGKLTNEIMSELNYQIEIEERTPEEVSKTFLIENGYIKG